LDEDDDTQNHKLHTLVLLILHAENAWKKNNATRTRERREEQKTKQIHHKQWEKGISKPGQAIWASIKAKKKPSGQR